jgi:predicted anti-sigma-YlaC factor YlaD
MNKIMHPIEPEEVMAYLDGELTANRATATAAHLGECAECQRLVAELRSVSHSLKTWKVEPPEPETPPAIETALAENRPESRQLSLAHQRSWREVLGQHWAILAWAGAVAAVLLVMFGTVRLPGGDANRMVDSAVVNKVPAGDSSTPREQASASTAASTGTRDKLVTFSSPGVAKDSNGLFHGLGEHRQSFSTDDQQGKVGANVEQRVGDKLPPSTGPMIIRTAELSLITKEFDKARANLEAILKRHRGYVGELKAGGTTGSGRTLTATLRVPADQLDATLTEVKTLGRVESESQSGQDVTSQYVDLQARLSNARNTEQRLTDLLRNRTGKLSDVLEVEQELDRVRGEIEQMEAERKNMSNQVSYATLNATIAEDYKAQLQVVPPSTSTRLSNAAVEGYRSMADGVVSLALFLLSTGPSLLLWGVVLFLPARLVWKKVRRSFAS